MPALARYVQRQQVQEQEWEQHPKQKEWLLPLAELWTELEMCASVITCVFVVLQACEWLYDDSWNIMEE